MKKANKDIGILIDFSGNIYSLKAVKSAIKEYCNLADFSFEKKKEYIRVRLKNIDEDIREIIRDEFCNYVLFLMKS